MDDPFTLIQTISGFLYSVRWGEIKIDTPLLHRTILQIIIAIKYSNYLKGFKLPPRIKHNVVLSKASILHNFQWKIHNFYGLTGNARYFFDMLISPGILYVCCEISINFNYSFLMLFLFYSKLYYFEKFEGKFWENWRAIKESCERSDKN